MGTIDQHTSSSLAELLPSVLGAIDRPAATAVFSYASVAAAKAVVASALLPEEADAETA